MAFADLSARFPLVTLRAAHDSIDAARLALAGRATAGLEPMALVVGDEAVTLWPEEPLRITRGVADVATLVVRFSDQQAFSDFHHELRTVPGAQVSGTLTFERGSYARFDDWEAAIRALYQGRAVFDPDSVDVAEAERTFTFGHDDDATIGAHVARFGFAVVRGVFTPAEVAEIDAAVARLESDSTPDTPATWWTHDETGNGRVCQIHYVSQRAPEIAWVDADPRITRLVEASMPGVVAHPDRSNGHFAVLKRPSASGGLTDLPWHIDCGLGGHTLLCPGLHIGIQLTASNPELGAFMVAPGSHETSVRRRDAASENFPSIVVDTQPGDVTIHVPHLLHAAPPPSGRGHGRRTLYLGFGRPEANELIGPGRSFDDLISATADNGFVDADLDKKR